MKRTPDTIKHLIIINIIMFLATQAMPQQMMNLFAMHFPLNPQFKVWQIITHMFMHANLMHIAFNMYALWAFGIPLYYIWGTKKFLIFYFAAGLGAVLLYTGVQYYTFMQDLQALQSQGISKEEVFAMLNSGQVYVQFKEMGAIYYSVMLGASGAIYGLLVAFAFYFPNAELMLIFIPYPIKAKYFVPLLILADLFLGITNVMHTPIAHMAHVGGALVGFILMKMWQKYDHRRWY
ncbi:MAG TPA: rhomboid family intramembrane serine protease [Flavobacteriales bacterium]|nr:rhomboid family intramembrane serine protease [Flavobacteriales bacterium]